MKYRVIGSNKDNAARMVMELDAKSKAAAECKAWRSGMVVNHAEPILEGLIDSETPSTRHCPMKTTGAGVIAKLAVLAVLVLLFYLLRGPLLNMLHTRF